ncbi:MULTISPECIES: hypothetical protein [unclassified Mesorhizobium]|uniref:hypothetical protein n=1 Tax=unclassified Mesorhizobium TaxID=325217 RepID=UPI000800FB71|nr:MULTISPECIES: hypothetical protein [unclassified Mesorhizobium]OBQ84667.1 hypothetical protein A9K71_21765 [Mesorhizobium sp. WSM3873]PBB80216.1 hypothetical protein CK218_16500 [Mesorhizobium sp. WSM3879]
MTITPTLKGFREGWARKAFEGSKAHFFRREGAGLATSLCGSQDAPAGFLFDAGCNERCARCAKLRESEIANEAAAATEDGQDACGKV